MNIKVFFPALIITLFFVTSCSTSRQAGEEAATEAVEEGFIRSVVTTKNFTLTYFHRLTDPNKPVNIYIEGDGKAWLSRTRPSMNPTPENPTAFHLAMEDPSANVIYLARPCQYTNFSYGRICNYRYWTDKRFAKPVISSTNEAIDKLLQFTTDKKINLIGFSGGGAVAALAAARRDDVLSLRTVAGNLNHVILNKFHNTSQMPESLNPVDFTDKISHIPQIHFSGSRDKIVPEFIASKFAAKVGNCARSEIVNGMEHNRGWKELWKELLQKNLPECGKQV